MRIQVSSVVVKQLTESLSRKQGRIFLSDVVNSISNDRAGIVLDCSRARLMDRPAIYLLLCCLEEAIKHDSDVKLAAIPAEAKAILKLTGVDRLFECFDTIAEAVISFRRLPVDLNSEVHVPFGSLWAPENAA
jgi:anti-anti-sigma regulatory factor